MDPVILAHHMSSDASSLKSAFEALAKRLTDSDPLGSEIKFQLRDGVLFFRCFNTDWPIEPRPVILKDEERPFLCYALDVVGVRHGCRDRVLTLFLSSTWNVYEVPGDLIDNKPLWDFEKNRDCRPIATALLVGLTGADFLQPYPPSRWPTNS